jgi:hypothetical protein
MEEKGNTEAELHQRRNGDDRPHPAWQSHLHGTASSGVRFGRAVTSARARSFRRCNVAARRAIASADFCLGRAAPSAMAMRARGRGTISRSQRGSRSAGDAQQPAGLHVGRAGKPHRTWRNPVARPRRAVHGNEHVLAGSKRCLHLPEPQPSPRVRCKRHRRHANAREPGAHGDTLHSRRHKGHGRAACHAAVKRERDEIVLVPGDPQRRALRERSFGDDLDRGASRHGTGIGRHKPAEGRGWRSNQSGWRSRHSP